MFHLLSHYLPFCGLQLFFSCCSFSGLEEEDKEAEDNAADNTADAQGLDDANDMKMLLYLEYTCMIVGSSTSKLREPAMCSGMVATESNQNTGNITSGKFLNRYSMPSTFLSNTFNCSLISTFRGIEDFGSTQNELS